MQINKKKLLLTYITLFVLYAYFCFSLLPIYAVTAGTTTTKVTATPTPSKLGSTTATTSAKVTPTTINSKTIEDAEKDIINKAKKELSLNFPEYTDDPNLAISFKTPTKDDINIQVDDKEYAKVKSPFVLPTLGIGQHKIVFKYKNTQAIASTLELNLVVIPKPPIFTNTPNEVNADQSLKIQGSAIPSAIIKIVKNGNEILTTTSDSQGKFEVSTTGFRLGKNNFTAIAIKNGYASEFSIKPLVVTSGSETTIIKPKVEKSLKDKFNDQIKKNQNWVDKNKTETQIMIFCLIAIIIVLIVYKYKLNKDKQKQNQTISDILKIKSNTVPLIDKLQKTLNNSEDDEYKDEKTKEENKQDEIERKKEEKNLRNDLPTNNDKINQGIKPLAEESKFEIPSNIKDIFELVQEKIGKIKESTINRVKKSKKIAKKSAIKNAKTEGTEQQTKQKSETNIEQNIKQEKFEKTIETNNTPTKPQIKKETLKTLQTNNETSSLKPIQKKIMTKEEFIKRFRKK